MGSGTAWLGEGMQVGAATIDTDETRTGTAPVAVREDSSAGADVPVRRAGAGLRWEVVLLRRARCGLSRAAIALLYAPAAAVLLLGALAALGVLGDLWRLGSAFSTHALTNVPDTYDRMALAARVALVSGAFLVLLCALVVVAVGCRGRRWWRLYLIPGVPLTVAAVLTFIFAAAWCVAAINLHLGWPPALWEILTALALADAVVVAARVGGIGAGPLGTRRARLRGRFGSQLPKTDAPAPASRQTRPIPVVRFGPRVTPTLAPDSPAPESQVDTLTAEAPRGDDAPTADELRAAAESGPVAHDWQEGDPAAAAGAA